MRFRRSMGALARVFAHVETFAREQQLDGAAAFALKLTVEELFTNLVRHDVGGSDHIDVVLLRVGRHVVARLVDHDVEPFDPDTVPRADVTAGLQERATGGLGVHLVRSLVDRLTYEYADRRLTVTAIRNLEGRHVQHRAG